MAVYLIIAQLALFAFFMWLRWTDGRPKMGSVRDRAEWLSIIGGAVAAYLL